MRADAFQDAPNICPIADINCPHIGRQSTGPDQKLSPAVKVRHGRNREGKVLHYYLNFSGEQQVVSYPYNNGSDLLTGASARQGLPLKLQPWDLAIMPKV